MKEITIEQVEVEGFYKFLQGKIPDTMRIEVPPNLNKEQAFSVIYYLQEILPVFPDSIESCTECGELFDANNEGVVCDDGKGCGACEDNFSWCHICEKNYRDSDKPEKSFFTLSKGAAEEQEMKPGLYSVKNFPVFTGDCLGINMNIIKQNVKLEIETKEYGETGFICEDCFKKAANRDGSIILN